MASALLVVVVGVLYFQALSNGFFLFDDAAQILQNPFVTNARLWQRIFSGSVWSFQGSVNTNLYRPLQIFSYWLIYRWAGPNPVGFHLVNLALYALMAWLVYRVGVLLLDSPLAAFVGALLWAAHPLHVEVVAWNSALPDAGVGFFYLLAFWFFLRAQRGEWSRLRSHALAAFAFFAALLFKESAITLPLLVLLYFWILSRGLSWQTRSIEWVPYLLPIALYAFLRVRALGHFTHVAHVWKFSGRTVAVGLALLGEHARLFFWPNPLGLFRGFDLAASLRAPWPWVLLVVTAGAYLWRKREPVMSFLVLWWVVTLLPVLDIRQLTFPLVADRFAYLPSVGLCLAIAFLALVWLPRHLPSAWVARFAVAGTALLVCAWSALTVRAIPNWRGRDEASFLQSELQKFPNSPMLHKNWADMLRLERHDPGATTAEYNLAMQLNLESVQPLVDIVYDGYVGLGEIAVERGRFAEGVDYLDKASRLIPGKSYAYSLLGTVYFPRGDFERAAHYFAKAVELNPQDVSARFYLGSCWMKLGSYREAAEQFRAAAEVDPSYGQALEAEAQALDAAGDQAGAARVRATFGAFPPPK